MTRYTTNVRYAVQVEEIATGRMLGAVERYATYTAASEAIRDLRRVRPYPQYQVRLWIDRPAVVPVAAVAQDSEHLTLIEG